MFLTPQKVSLSLCRVSGRGSLRGAGLVGEMGLRAPAVGHMQALREFYPTNGFSVAPTAPATAFFWDDLNEIKPLSLAGSLCVLCCVVLCCVCVCVSLALLLVWSGLVYYQGR